jgi:predicted esterase
MYAPEMEELAEKNGFLVAMAYGRSNTEFMGVGETEVLNTLNFTKELFKVDERRVVLSGASMGGSGTYTIACHHPDLFAGTFSISARMDYFMWMGVKKEDLAPFKRIQGDLDYARDMLGNLLHVPVFLFHGGADRRPYPEVEQSRVMEQLLTQMGQRVQYKEFEGLGHQIWSESFSFPPLAPWLTNCESPALPKRVKFKTYSLKYNRAYWLTILDFIEWGKPAVLDATVEEGNRIVLKTENIASLRLDPSDLLDYARPVTVTLNGGEAKTMAAISRGKPFDVDVRREVLAGPSAYRKTPDICGPVRDAYCSRFLIVPGTSGTEEEKRTEMSHAQNAAHEWIGFTQGVAHVKTDAAVTPDDIRDCNLILYGSPFTNRIVAKIAPDLPIKIERDEYVVGDRRVPRKDAGLMMIYPNPLNSNRYVVICDGQPWGKALDVNHKLDLVPDFIIYTQDVDPSGAAYEYLLGVCGINQYVCAGYFDKYWRLSKDVTWWNERPTPAEH